MGYSSLDMVLTILAIFSLNNLQVSESLNNNTRIISIFPFSQILAKVEEDKPVAMDTLAKIAAALECELDDIVEISAEQ